MTGYPAPELLAPAGNFDKMKAAIRFGADAVYLAFDRFGMRAAADNFSLEQLKEAVQWAHEHHARVYLTLNTLPHGDEYPALKDFLTAIADFGIDAVIAADLGVITLVKQLLPTTDIHISTQASAVSAEACLAWYALGAKRVVLARELTLDEIKKIREKIPDDLELEAFIHGSMCISYSGRCLLSQHFIGRDANRGFCAQPCRWNMSFGESTYVGKEGYEGCAEYEMVEEKRPDDRIPIVETNRGTFFLSSKDTCMIEHIPELIEAGINSFKIEGRMKSEYYAAVVSNTYRMAIDAYLKDPDGYRYDPAWLRELESVSHREYHTGFYFDKPTDEANTAKTPGYLKENAYLCRVEAYDEATGMATLIQRNKLFAGTRAEVLTPGKIGQPIVIGNLFDEEGNEIESTPHPYMRFFTKTQFPVKPGDILRGVSD